MNCFGASRGHANNLIYTGLQKATRLYRAPVCSRLCTINRNPKISVSKGVISMNGHSVFQNGSSHGFHSGVNNNKPVASSNVNQMTRLEQGEDFLNDVIPGLLKKIFETYQDRSKPVVNFVQPEELKKAIDLELSDEPLNDASLEKLLEQVIKYSVKTGHPYFYNQLFCGVDPFALSGAFLTEALNCSAYTYEIGPVNTLIESEIIRKVALEQVGFTEADGIFAPGGSIGNMYGLSLARQKCFPDCKSTGMQGLPPVHLYTSKESHYSIKKAASFMGFGLDNLVMVETDSKGKMIPEDLDRAMTKSEQEGFVPLFVNATAGTTVIGAYDPLDKIADVCDKHGGVWLHLDACWGGAVLLSKKLRYKLSGIHRVDSLVWDPHKMTGAILQCALVLTKHPGLLNTAHCANARYLFQQDKVYDCSYDTGDKSIQCGRKIDAFKFWVQWKAYGSKGMAERIEQCFENALYLRDRLQTTEGFRLILEDPECTNVCFWYIPKKFRGQEENDEWFKRLSTVAPAIKGRMQVTGAMMIGYQPQGKLVNFFRMIFSNPATTKDDVDHIITTIETFGEECFN